MGGPTARLRCRASCIVHRPESHPHVAGVVQLVAAYPHADNIIVNCTSDIGTWAARNNNDLANLVAESGDFLSLTDKSFTSAARAGMLMDLTDFVNDPMQFPVHDVYDSIMDATVRRRVRVCVCGTIRRTPRLGRISAGQRSLLRRTVCGQHDDYRVSQGSV